MNNLIFERGSYRVYYMDSVYKVMAVQKGKIFKLGSCLTEKEAINFCKNLAKGNQNEIKNNSKT